MCRDTALASKPDVRHRRTTPGGRESRADRADALASQLPARGLATTEPRRSHGAASLPKSARADRRHRGGPIRADRSGLRELPVWRHPTVQSAPRTPRPALEPTVPALATAE